MENLFTFLLFGYQKVEREIGGKNFRQCEFKIQLKMSHKLLNILQISYLYYQSALWHNSNFASSSRATILDINKYLTTKNQTSGKKLPFKMWSRIVEQILIQASENRYHFDTKICLCSSALEFQYITSSSIEISIQIFVSVLTTQ